MLLGYLGPRTNSEIAAKKYAASVAGLGISAYRNIDEVFASLIMGEVDLIAVPVYNSLTGPIGNNERKIIDAGFKKLEELVIPIVHCIGSRSLQIDFIASHPEVFRQCNVYLHRAFLDYPRIEVESTERAANLAFENKGIAAIANPETCSHYRLRIIRRNIVKDSFSTFWILGK